MGTIIPSLGGNVLDANFQNAWNQMTKASFVFTGFMSLFLRAKILTLKALTVPYLMWWEVLLKYPPLMP